MAKPHAEGLDRRTFVTAAAAAVGSLATGSPRLMARSSPRLPTRRVPPFAISLAEWSLHRALKNGDLDNLGFPAKAKTFGIDAVEYVNSFFKDKARDAAYLKELNARCKGEGVRSLLIMCDGEGALGDPDAGQRSAAVTNHHRWVEAAAALGCHSIRVNAQSAGSRDEQRKLAADGLRRLCEYGDRHGVNVIVENHGGLSSDGSWLAAVLKAVDHPRIGALPDFGNFRVDATTEYDRYRGVAELMPFAKGVSAKSHDFDERGDETHTDYRRMLRIVVVEHGYHGHVGIEYEGAALPEDGGIRRTRDLLLAIRAELEAAAKAPAAEPTKK